MFTTESGRSRKLEAHWRGPFPVLEYDEFTQNYTVKMDSRIYRRDTAVFHCSVVKPYQENNDQLFPGRANTKPAPIPINEEPEWEVEAILDYRVRYGRGQFLVKWKDYPASENSWEPIEGLKHAEEMVQAWWTDNMVGEEFPVYSGWITIRIWPTKASFTEFGDEGRVDTGF